LAYSTSELVGFYLARWVADEAELMFISVTRPFRRQGLACLMLQDLIHVLKAQAIESLMLEVRASNLSAIDLYKKQGFVKTGERKGYYPPVAHVDSLNFSVPQKETALLYSLDLSIDLPVDSSAV